MPMRTLLAILAALLLSGCWWEGPVFYPPDPAAEQPLQPGLYEVTDSDGKVERTRIVRAPDGSLVPGPEERKKDNSKLFFVRLPMPGRDLWISEMISTDPAKAGAAYGLVEPRGDTITHNIVIDCDSTADLVRAAGGVVEEKEGANLSCRFNDAASLERALRAYAAKHPVLDQELGLKRVGD
jgi:predicted small lipoprotein YifL